jgi:hypothetical protein
MGGASAADTASQVITPAGNQAFTMGSAARFDGRVRVDPLGQANASRASEKRLQ